MHAGRRNRVGADRFFDRAAELLPDSPPGGDRLPQPRRPPGATFDG